MLASIQEFSQQIDRWFQSRPKLRWLALALANGSVYTVLSVFVGGDSLLWGVSLGTVCGITFATVYTGLKGLRAD